MLVSQTTKKFDGFFVLKIIDKDNVDFDEGQSTVTLLAQD